MNDAVAEPFYQHIDCKNKYGMQFLVHGSSAS